MHDSAYDFYFRTYTGVIFGNDIDWLWMKSQAIAESGLDPEAVSPVGALGVMQLMPKTAAWMASRHDISNRPDIPHINIQLGIHYARRCWRIWREEKDIERIRFMLASYNAGPGNVIKAQRVVAKRGLPSDQWDYVSPALAGITGEHAAETLFYVSRVEAVYNQLVQRRKG